MSSSPQVDLHDLEPTSRDFLDDVIEGLSRPQKQLPCKYFYDGRGCELFDRICELDEYYPTRTELSIMRQSVNDMAATIGSECMLVEYGSGASVKTRMLLDNLESISAYVPVDIARDYLEQAASSVAADYPDVEVLPICADFGTSFKVPSCSNTVRRRVAYFPGSTIGNLELDDAVGLLRSIAEVCGENGGLLIGIDLHKPSEILEAAYNDSQGVTADFNLNLLHRINRELDADFQVSGFRHHAFYDRQAQRVEMQLICEAPHSVSIGDEEFWFDDGEAISTEYSHKYRLEDFVELAAAAGFSVDREWTDAEAMFAVLFCTVD